MAGYLVFVVFTTVLSKAKGEDLAAPTLSVKPEIITKSGSVTLHCQTPVPVNSHCFYSFDKAPGKEMPCHQTINGSKLLSLLNINLPSEIHVACFYLNATTSPLSENKVISVRDPGPPTVAVHPSVITEFSSVTLYCQPPLYVSVSSCSFYTLSGLEWARSSCTRTLKGSDLLKNNQSAPAEVQVKCYYTEQNEETSPSPHSNKTIVAIKVLAAPTLTVEPSVITEMDRVILHCQPPSYVSASLCYFYTVSASSGKTLDATGCVQNLTGSDLFSVNESPPVEVEIQCFYIVDQKTSPHSNKSTIMVKATKITSTTSPPSTSTLFNPETNTGTQAHGTGSETVKAQNSDNSTATKSLIKMLVILLTAGGVTVGCVLLVVTFFCTKQRNDKVKSQAPNSGGQLVVCKYSLSSPEPATDSQGETVTETQPDVQQEVKVTETNPYHEYASIPDKPYSVSVKNVMYSSLEMTEQ